MKWLVEEYDDYVKDLVKEIEKQGHTCDFIKYYDMIQDPHFTGEGLPKTKGKFADEECVLFYGSIQLAGWLTRHKKWIPTVWYNYDKYKVSHWSSFFGDHMINNNFFMLPVGVIRRRWRELFFRITGKAKDLFIRPDSGTKAFGGRVFHYETFEKDWDRATHLMDDSDMCVLSEPVGIGKEWRFIVSNGEVITGSQYKDKGSAEVAFGYSLAALKKAEELAAMRYDPDPMYTIDIGQSGDDFYLIEINNFCCSGLYACNLEAIVRKASELAVAEHREYYP